MDPSTAPAHAAGAVVMASVAALDPGGWYPFVVAKWAAVSVALLVAWWCALGSSRRPLPRWFTVSFAGLVALLAVAAVFGRDPLYAWIGTPERHLGVLTWCLFGVAVFVGAALDSDRRRLVFGRWVALATLLAGVYALIERFVGSPVEVSTVTDRLGGPYGSASLFGAALCLLLPVTAAVAIGDTRFHFVSLAALGLATFALVSTGTRAAWVGVVVGALFVAIARWPHRRRWRPALLLLPAAAVGAAAGFVSLGGAAQRSGGGGGSRLDEWGVGVRIVAAHPWLGVGPEGYRTALADGVTTSYERTYGREVLADRAHNGLIDVAAAGGVGAALLYAMILGLVAVTAWRVIRRDPAAGAGWLPVGMAVAVVAYFAQQLFLFPVATIDPIAYLMIGSLLTATPRSRENYRRYRANTPGRWAVLVGAVVMFGVGVLGVAADRAARVASDDGNLAAAERAVTLRPDIVRYRLLAAASDERSLTSFVTALDQVEAALRISPHDPIVLRRQAEVLFRVAVATGEPSDVHAALATWASLATDANCYRCQLGYGYAAALADQPGAARIGFERAAVLAPEDDHEATAAIDAIKNLPDQGTDSDG